MILLKPVMNVVGECKNNFHIIKSIEHKEEFLDLYGQFGCQSKFRSGQEI